MTEKINNLFQRLSRGAWTIGDQALYVLSTIALNLFLARTLTQEDYGMFAVIYSGLMFLGAVYMALLVEPMQVFADGRFRESRSDYMKWLWRKHWIFTGCVCVLLLLISALLFVFDKLYLCKSFALLGLIAPFALLSWLSRRAACVYSKPQQAAISSAFYLMFIVAGLFCLNLAGRFSVYSTLVLLGVANGITASVLFVVLQRNIVQQNEKLKDNDALKNHWRYGRWAVLTSLLMWLPLNFFVVYFSHNDLAASGSWRAITNLYLPAFQANAALSALILPALVRRLENTNDFLRTVWESVGGVVFIAFTYSIFLFLFGNQLVHLLYGGRYDAQSLLLKLLILMPVLDACCVVLSAAMRAREKPQAVLFANMTGVFVLITIGIFLPKSYGLRGAAIATLASSAITACCLFFAVKQQTAQPKTNVGSYTPLSSHLLRKCNE